MKSEKPPRLDGETGLGFVCRALNSSSLTINALVLHINTGALQTQWSFVTGATQVNFARCTNVSPLTDVHRERQGERNHDRGAISARFLIRL